MPRRTWRAECSARARIHRARIAADRPDPVTTGRIGRDSYLAYLVISGHKNGRKPTRFIPVGVMRARWRARDRRERLVLLA